MNECHTWVRMERHLIGGLLVHPFDDVHLPIRRPIGASRPESGPDATDVAGHVANVDDDEGMVVRSFAVKPDTFAATAGSNACRVNGELHTSTALAEQAAAGAVDIVNVARSRICVGKESESIQEITARVVILQAVSCKRELAQIEVGNERQQQHDGKTTGSWETYLRMRDTPLL